MKGFEFGELILAIRSSGVRKLVKLCEGGDKSCAGVTHNELVSRRTSYLQINGNTFRRPTLDEYVVLMKRTACPTYPKDAQTMVAMLALASGSRVLEAGTGSGGLTLYLSKNGRTVARLGFVHMTKRVSCRIFWWGKKSSDIFMPGHATPTFGWLYLSQ